MKKLSLILVWFFVFKASSQDVNYAFIDRELNRLHFSSDSTAISGLYDKLDKISRGEKEQVKIAHIGGSHVQAGIWSNALLKGFLDTFKTEAGGYFVFPYKVAKTNGQPYATSYSNGYWKRCRSIGKEFCQPLGMNALSITTNDSTNNFGIALTKYASCKAANVVKVYHNFNESFSFNVCVNDSIHYKRTEVPDQGYTMFAFSKTIDSVQFELRRTDTVNKDFTLFGFSIENTSAAGFYLAGLGANGASSASFLKCNMMGCQLPGLNADIVIISLGVNDTQSNNFSKEEFSAHYDSLILMVKTANPKATIILTTTTDNFIKRSNPNKRTIVAKEAMFDLMIKHNIVVWDLFTLMGGYKSILKWQKAGLASKDRVHFTPKGYNLTGQMLFEAIYKSYANYLKKV